MPTNSAGQNFRRTRESSLFGTRKLAFYTVQASTDYNMIGARNSGYSFRVNTTTGAVTFNATITSRDYLSMNDLNSGEMDDGTYQLEFPFNTNSLPFLGNNYSAVYVNSNGGLMFADDDTRDASPITSSGAPAVFIANNDGDYQYIYDEITGTPGTQQYRVKVRGNTDYQNDTVVNFVWEVVFYEDHPEYIDFLVTAQPTDWNAYNDGQGNVVWGVTNGSNWVDGLSDHFVSYAPFTVLADENWNKSNSIYYQVVRAIQQAGVELYWLGTPHNTSEPFQVDWTPLTPDDNADSFTFAIADDADAPQAFLDGTTTGTVAATAGNVPNSIDLDNIPNNVYVGQRVVFTGTTIGGLVAGKDYYVKTKGLYATDSKLWITVSETADNEVLDITYPKIVGGEPGPEVELTADTGEFTATFYNYNIEWGGTAGDIMCACCTNLTEPNVIPTRLSSFINDSGAFPGSSGYWFVYRSNPSYGIFPAFWQAQP
ncbi:hypothetical protein UFOVP181_85 [uncultured Caudovirales phage]|uniref:Uncharacterized protein n=1 Tax=uncultured Caudovirales phage TaxID=2100421 RepID=A0A6J5KVM1_9CAUD|nr:hypothetical protein UFOVP57_77 [uncultured Caudovirales phage]CAB5208606.1 hypothetical protein UFOVP181_85 [uncultured Caudovirales phage]